MLTKAYLTIILLLASITIVYADCKIDRFGDVYCGMGKCETDNEGKVFCSKYRYGDAVINKYGSVVCGKGKCLAGTEFNGYFCSIVEGGGVGVDKLGAVKCYGGCEKASPLMCESEKGK